MRKSLFRPDVILILTAVSIFTFAGTFTAMLKFASISLPASLQSLVFVAYLPVCISYLGLNRNKINWMRLDVAVLMLLLVLVCLKLIYFIGQLNTYSFLNGIYYITVFCFFGLIGGLNRDAVVSLRKFLFGCLSYLVLIGGIQRVFFAELPSAFVQVPVILESFNSLEYSREIDGITVFAANGLYANPIVYGGILTLYLSLCLCEAERTMSKRFLLFALATYVLLISMMSRVNILVASILLTIYMLRNANRWILPIILISIFVLLNTVLMDQFPVLRFIADRFSGADDWAIASNLEHAADVEKALLVIGENYAFGINFYDYVIKDIITDGAWFIFALDIGILSSVLICCLLVIWSRRFAEISLRHRGNVYMFSFCLLTAATGFINSFLVDKPSFIILMLTCYLWSTLGARVSSSSQ